MSVYVLKFILIYNFHIMFTKKLKRNCRSMQEFHLIILKEVTIKFYVFLCIIINPLFLWLIRRVIALSLYNNINVLKRSLDASSLRQRLITDNIANVDTPGYKSKDISFDQLLAEESSKNGSSFQGYRTNPRHFVIGGQASYQPKVVTDNSSILNNDNNVDIDYEMTKMAENNIWYNGLTQVMNKEFSLLRYVITEGRR